MPSWVQFTLDWNILSAYGATHVFRQIPSYNREVVAFNQHLITVWAVSVFARVS